MCGITSIDLINFFWEALNSDYRLHTLGWKAFQDLGLAVAQECLQRPIQRFLPSQDGGRDGAFVGTMHGGDSPGSSTIQCKFTSLSYVTHSVFKRANFRMFELNPGNCASVA
jgi:hypothetical protein